MHIKIRKLLVLIVIYALSMPLILHAKQLNQQTKHAAKDSHNKSTHKIIGLASFYGAKFNGRRTASGEKYNHNALTAAHKTLPFGSKVQVTNVRNGKSVVVRINDRGPFVKGRIIDLSKAAAKQIGLGHSGTARVKLEVLKK